MSLITKRYLVSSEVSRPCVLEQRRLEEAFLQEVADLRPGKDGVTLLNYADRNMDLIERHNSRVQEAYARFARENHIASELSSNKVEGPSFDNFFGWDIAFVVHGDRLFMEVRAASMRKFPIKADLPFLHELDEQKYYILSGRKTL